MFCEIYQTLVHQVLVQFKVLLTPELHQDRQQVEQQVQQMLCLLLISFIQGLQSRQTSHLFFITKWLVVPKLRSQVKLEGGRHSYKSAYSPLWLPS